MNIDEIVLMISRLNFRAACNSLVHGAEGGHQLSQADAEKLVYIASGYRSREPVDMLRATIREHFPHVTV